MAMFGGYVEFFEECENPLAPPLPWLVSPFPPAESTLRDFVLHSILLLG
jgi:hypothetical protein